MLELTRVRRDFLKEHEMNTQPPTPGNQSASTVVMIVGGAMLLLALGGSLALYFWGRTPPSGGGEQWNDVIASIFIVFLGLPAFFIGLLLLLIGWFQKVRGKRKAAQPDQ
jgi:hypothetical protein